MKKLITLILTVLLIFSSCVLTNNIIHAEEENNDVSITETQETVEVYEEDDTDITDDDKTDTEVIDDTSQDDNNSKDDTDITDDFIEEIPEQDNQETYETQDTRSSEGTAYAVLTDDGDLIFFRSNKTYTNKSSGTFYDTKNRVYEGTIFLGFETAKYSTTSSVPWYERNVLRTYVVDDYVISPISTKYWFIRMRNLISVDLKNVNTSNTVDMSDMFYYCSSLSSLDLSHFDTSKVTDMESMFNGCESLININLSSFNTSAVRSMKSMFGGCNSLTTLELTNFDTSNVTDMAGMFAGCLSLTSLDFSSFNTSNVTDMHDMFNTCKSLTSLDLTNFDTSNVISASTMFRNCSSLESINLSGFDTAKVQYMSGMFENCSSLKSIDLSNFDTSNVILFSSMFRGCSSLISLDLSNFDTSKSNNLSLDYMFSGCSSLKSIDLSSFDTSKAKLMNGVFSGCSSLTMLDLSNFVTPNLIDTEEMFKGCSSLISIDLSGFDTSNVRDMKNMFLNCQSLKKVKLGNGWKVWMDNAYLPAGKWYHESLVKDETQLYKDYPLYAETWAGWWIKDKYDVVDFEGFTSDFTLGRDNNGFKHAQLFSNESNTSFTFDKRFWDTIVELNGKGLASSIKKKTQVRDSNGNFKEWSGSCYGISLTMATVFNDLYSASNLSQYNAENYYELKPYYIDDQGLQSHTDKLLLNYIQYYYHSQTFIEPYDTSTLLNEKDGMIYVQDLEYEPYLEYDNYYFKIEEALEGLVNYLSSNKEVCVFGYIHESGHAILATGITYDPSNKQYIIELYDLNYPDRFGHLYIKNDFSKYRFAGITDSDKANKQLKQFYVVGSEKIQRLVNKTEDLLWKHLKEEIIEYIFNCFIDYLADSSFIITFDDGSTLTYTGGTFSGSAEILSRTVMVNESGENGSNYETIEIKDFDSFTITPLSDNVDITVHNNDNLLSIEGTGIDNATLSFSDGITIEGTDYEFESFITADIYSGDESVMNSIKGSSSGTTRIHKKNGKIVAENTNGIYPEESSTYIGVNDYTKQYDGNRYNTITIDDHQYSKDEYLITFKSDIEGFNVEDKYLSYGSYITRPSDPQIEGIIFNGWYTSEVFQNEDTLWDFDNNTVDSNVVLYASYDYINADDISLDRDNIRLYLGETDTLIHSLSPLNTYIKEVMWRSSDEDVVTVSDDGVLTPVGEGTATVSVHTIDGTDLKAECVVTVIDPYGDILESDRPLNPEDIPDGLWYSFDASEDEVYTGKAIKKSFRVYEHKKLLKEKTDYTVTYKNNTNAGTAVITINGKGNYTSSDTIEFNILPVDINSEDIVISDIAAVKENGKIQKLKPVIKWKGKTLSLNKDYTLEYNDHYDDRTAYQDSGYYRVTIKGTGNYVGERVATYEIAAQYQTLISKLSLTKIKDIPYDGTEKTPDVLLKSGKDTLTNGVDYELSYSDNNTDIGTVTVTITGKGLYSGTRTTTFKITGTSLTKAKLNNFESSLDYSDGSPVVQNTSFTITDKDKNVTVLRGIDKETYETLSDKQRRIYDYTYEYQNNISPGKATVIYTGINAYTGTVKKTFTIKGIALSKTKIEGLTSSFIYDGTNKYQDITVTYLEDKNGSLEILEIDKDYELSYTNNDKAGTATVIITGKGKYTGTVKKTYKISPYDISKDSDNKIYVQYDEAVPYSKAGARPSVKVYFGSRLLKNGTDYAVSYSNNTNINDGSNTKKLPTIIIKGKGNFTGTNKDNSFTIFERDIDSVSMYAQDKVYSLSKNGWKSSVTLTDNGKKLSSGKDYDKNISYTYENDTIIKDGSNKNKPDIIRYKDEAVMDTDIIPAGTQIRVTVTGMGSYYGEKSYIYRISKADINKTNVTIEAKEYTGKPVTITKEDITVKLGKEEIDPSNYEIDDTSYINNIKKGKATVVLKGINDLGSTKKVSFTIGPKSFLWWLRNLGQ